MISTKTLNERLQIILERLEDMDKKLDSLHFSSNHKDPLEKRLQTWLNQ